MTQSLIKFGFSAGVLSGSLLSRKDIDKFELGLRSSINWVVAPLGGIKTRPSLEFVDYLEGEDEDILLRRFQFNDNIENSYIIIFERDRIRFAQDGAYVLETAQTVENVAGATVTITGHGYSTGDWLKISTELFSITVLSANTFDVAPVSGVATSVSIGDTAARVYTVVSPYLPTEFSAMVFDQRLDELVITHVNHPRRKLIRTDVTNWAIEEVDEGLAPQAVANLAAVSSAGGVAGVVYVIAVLDNQGNELPLAPENFIQLDNVVNLTTDPGQISLTWDAVTNASGYRVYRSYFAPDGGTLNIAADLGFIGFTRAPAFVDANIIPDFSRAPLQASSLFLDGAIAQIDITAGGTGYTNANATVTMNGGGTGFAGLPVVNDSGEIISVLILSPGSGYTNPTLTFGGGTGATATVTTTPADGNNPAAVAVSQQRRVYAGTTNNPNTVFGSRITSLDSFASSGFARDNDPYVFTTDQPEFTPIRYMSRSRDGLFLFGASEIAQLRGIDDRTITPSSARIVPQTEEGVAQVPPIPVERQFLYLTASRAAVRSLQPSNLPTYFTTVSLSRLVPDIVNLRNGIVSWAWVDEDERLIWAIREDGTAALMTLDTDVEVFSWTEAQTNGRFKRVESIKENNLDVAYIVVERNVNGQTRKYLERTKSVEPTVRDDMWGVDSGLRSTLTFPAASIRPSAFEAGIITVTASSAVFSSGDVGKHFRLKDGFGVVTVFTSTTEITVDLYRTIREDNTQFKSPPWYEEGQWSLTTPQTVFGGLAHLEGCEVEILADGSVQPPQIVQNGQVTIESPADLVLVGLNFTAEAQTLPPDFVGQGTDDLRGQMKELFVRFYKSGEVDFGDGDLMYPVTDTGDEPVFDVPAPLFEGVERVGISMIFDFDQTIYMRKSGPIQAHILGYAGSYDIETD